MLTCADATCGIVRYCMPGMPGTSTRLGGPSPRCWLHQTGARTCSAFYAHSLLKVRSMNAGRCCAGWTRAGGQGCCTGGCRTHSGQLPRPAIVDVHGARMTSGAPGCASRPHGSAHSPCCSRPSLSTASSQCQGQCVCGRDIAPRLSRPWRRCALCHRASSSGGNACRTCPARRRWASDSQAPCMDSACGNFTAREALCST